MYVVNLHEAMFVMVAFLCFCNERMVKVNVKLVPVCIEAQHHEGTQGD
jgi:hypothetical protein